MREILFRGKSEEDGEWLYGLFDDEHHNADFPCILPDWRIHSVNDVPGSWGVDPDTVGQFTGLTDKKGKKIFEGDIVEYNDGFDYFEGVIVFEYGAYGIGTKEIIGISSGCCDNFANLWQLFWDQPVVDNAELYYCKVIGNIHDNPELLKGE